MKRLLKSFHYAWSGIIYTFRTQSNFKIHLIGFIFMNTSAFYFQFNLSEYMVCLLLAGLILFAEVLNTAIEAAVDLTTKEWSHEAKIAKDCAAGAVLILAILSVLIWSIIVYSKFS